MPKVLVVTYGGGHVNMLIPIIKQMQNSGHQVVVLGLTTASAALSKASIEYIGFQTIIKFCSNPTKALELGASLVGAASASSVVPHAESIAYHGVCYLELVDLLGETQAASEYHSKGRQSFFPIKTLQAFMAELQPDLVIATNSPRTEQSAIKVAREQYIPAICLVDLFAIQEIEWLGQVGYADKICVLSDFVKDKLLKAGRSNEEIVVTGNPVFDSLVQIKQQRLERKVEKVLLWASQPEPSRHPFTGASGDPELPRKIDHWLITIAKKRPQWRIIIRPHPSENVSYGELPSNVGVSNQRESLHQLLKQVDAVLTMTSTVGLEAALIGVPVITYDGSVFTQDAPYSSMGISKGVKNLSDLEHAIEQGFEQSAKPNVASLPPVGNAVENVMKQIDQLLDVVKR